jgi:hypothetical protein
VKRYSTSRPLNSHYSPIPNWIRFNSAIFAWRNQSSGIPPLQEKGTTDILAEHPSVSLLIGSTGKSAFLSFAKTIKHAVAGITADTVVVGCCNSRVFRSSPNFSVSCYLAPDPAIDELILRPESFRDY